MKDHNLINIRTIFTTVFYILSAITGKVYGDLPDYEYLELDNQPRIIDSIFNVSSLTAGIFNNSFLTVGAVIIVGIILFELALYALDVYYNQTYQSQYAYNKIDEHNTEANVVYPGYPTYYDVYTTTYRGFQPSGINFKKILEWIYAAHQMYEMTDENLLGDLECQKKLVCEMYENPKALGELSKRGRHAVDFMEQMAHVSLPDELLNYIDEISDAKSNRQEKCEKIYPSCDKSLTRLFL